MQFRLTLNSLCSPCGPQSHGNPPTLALGVLGLQSCTTALSHLPVLGLGRVKLYIWSRHMLGPIQQFVDQIPNPSFNWKQRIPMVKRKIKKKRGKIKSLKGVSLESEPQQAVGQSIQTCGPATFQAPTRVVHQPGGQAVGRLVGGSLASLFPIQRAGLDHLNVLGQDT